MEFGTTKPFIYFNKNILEQHELPTRPKCISRCWCHVSVKKRRFKRQTTLGGEKKHHDTPMYLVPWAILLGVSRLTSLNQHISKGFLLIGIAFKSAWYLTWKTHDIPTPKITLEPPTWKGWWEGVVPPSSSETTCWYADMPHFKRNVIRQYTNQKVHRFFVRMDPYVYNIQW